MSKMLKGSKVFAPWIPAYEVEGEDVLNFSRFAAGVSWIVILSCAQQEENENFSLSLESSVSVSGASSMRTALRCDAESDLDCGRLDFVTGEGFTVDQPDAFTECSVTPEGDLRIAVKVTSEADSLAQALFLVHRNATPNGTARCQGILPDATSPSGFMRSSCDVVVKYADDIFSATPFDSCTATVTSTDVIKGSVSCPLLRSGKTKTLLVNAIGFHCVPLPATSESEVSGLRAWEEEPP